MAAAKSSSHVQQSTWWDDERILATVTREFVCSHLHSAERVGRLDRPLGFGDRLTESTYWEWIDQRAKRIFLVLLDIGLPDQIFDLIDASLDDDNLPITPDQVERLKLSPGSRDGRLEKKFYYRQFYYLLKPLRKGEHVVYLDSEVVPLDVVTDRRVAALTQSSSSSSSGGGGGCSGSGCSVDKVIVPSCPGSVFCRRRIRIGSGPGCVTQEDFQCEIDSIRNVQNEHLVSYFCSYVHQGYGYVLFSPTSDGSLKSALATTPASVKSLDKDARRLLVINWIHCLVDTLCFIHSWGMSHGNIRPSTILLNNENHIFFSDFTRLNADVSANPDRTSFDKEAYDYAAPEQWYRPSSSASANFNFGSPGGGGIRKNNNTSASLSVSPESNGSFSISRGAGDHASSPAAMIHAPNPHLNPQAADVFSLGCIILELLSFLMKRQTRSFASHRAARHKTPGRGGAVLDSSFHRNLGQVESWMTGLAKEAKNKEGGAFRGVLAILHVAEKMLALQPSERPSIHDVQTRMYQILTGCCGIAEPHCVHQYGGWDYSLGSLKKSSVGPARARKLPIGSPPRGRAIATTVGNHGDDDDDDDDDNISIATSKGSSSQSVRQMFYPGRHHQQQNHYNQHHYQHARSSSSSGGADGSRAWGGEVTSASEREMSARPRDPVGATTPESPASPSSLTTMRQQWGGGLMAIRNLKLRDKPARSSQWQESPTFAGTEI